MTPRALQEYLKHLVAHQLMFSTMIWGPPGIGKSSIVAQLAADQQLGFVDVRLSQLAPTDLRGLPVPENGISRWYPPEFLPREGAGILFLDELNLAPPTMQGMAQQLILDRRVGSYEVPTGWYIWAAGNRKEDQAMVFDMPAPLANRFLHLTVEPDFESFKAFALEHGAHEQILAFLSFRPDLLHRLSKQQQAWPSPRSWMMASALHAASLSLAPAIGESVEAEFKTFLKVYKDLPDLDAILLGGGESIAFPKESSVRYATTIGLTVRAEELEQNYNAFRWLLDKATTEWTQLYVADLVGLLRSRHILGKLAAYTLKDAKLKAFLDDYLGLLGGD